MLPRLSPPIWFSGDVLEMGNEDYLRILANRGPNNPNFGKPFSEETKRKLSLTKKGPNHQNYGKHLSVETKEKISSANKGANNPNYEKHPSKETRMKQSLAKKGRPCSEEAKKKLSLSVRRTLEYRKKKACYQKKYYQANREKILSYTRDYNRKRMLDRVDAVFELFGYSVDSLNKMGAALES